MGIKEQISTFKEIHLRYYNYVYHKSRLNKVGSKLWGSNNMAKLKSLDKCLREEQLIRNLTLRGMCQRITMLHQELENILPTRLHPHYLRWYDELQQFIRDCSQVLQEIGQEPTININQVKGNSL